MSHFIHNPKMVWVVNGNKEELRDKWDGQPYRFEPGKRYRILRIAADHFFGVEALWRFKVLEGNRNANPQELAAAKEAWEKEQTRCLTRQMWNVGADGKRRTDGAQYLSHFHVEPIKEDNSAITEDVA